MADIRRQLQKASKLCQKGKLKEAAVVLQKILSHSPDSIPALNMYGITLAQTGNIPLATAQFSRILKSQPSNAAALENLARTYMQTGNFQQAKTIYEQLITIKPVSYNAYFGLAGALMSLNLLSESLKMFLKAEALNNSELQLYVNMGTVFSQLNQIDEAIKSFNKALTIDTNSMQANLRLGQLYLKNNNGTKAEEFLSKADKIQANDFEINLSLADAYQHNFKNTLALKHYFLADALERKSQNVYTKLDKLILHDGNAEKELLLDKLSKEHIYESWSEAKTYANKLCLLTDYFDKAALEALRLFIENYHPDTLHPREWWQKQLLLFGDMKFGHDKILRGIHSAVFSWSLPDKETLTSIAEFVKGTRLYSYGAGSALWERLLSEHFSVEVKATDFKPRHSYLPIAVEDYSKSIIPEMDTIFLSWIIRGDTGIKNILTQMKKGQKLILLGEPPDQQGIPRICATPEIFSLLKKEFTLTQSIPLVSFSMLNDTASLYIKK